ncbi:DEAD/DEAH box helicase [Apibacter adventoris]|uniref:DEAD-box ATP-dependent RNA helicase RhpA n=1 Tax=Apibacter adventoris TaxID=1679466 RepID=A0A2S8A7K9_9FLAO|nr:DEAD/DEAH box helicase [Apibacter adventoris]PQL90549.1 DEAD/DEAH box helicase [Apibacter adventoris]
MTFKDLKIIEPILRALKEQRYLTPTPIQQKAIPILLQKKDILGCAQTGTGKTAAFSIPIIQLLSLERNKNNKDREIKALILTPTRELAIQINDSFTKYNKYLDIKHTVIFGGVKQKIQVDNLQKGIEVLIATPGRLLDLIQQGFIQLNKIKYFVLDEADRMLDMGFIHDIKRILPKLPKEKQTLFFSATMPPVISGLANSILHNPVKIKVTPVSSTADTIKQSIYFVEKVEKKDLLIRLIKETDQKSILVFTRTKYGADKIARVLCKAKINSEAIHGDKSQNSRQRALINFKTGKTQVLVATDIAARGIDIHELEWVINYDLPNVPETYVHRIGRTGRAGNNGTAISFCAQDERPYLKEIQKLIGKKIKVISSELEIV